VQFLNDIWLVVSSYVRTIGVADVIDILVVTYLFYTILTAVRRTSAGAVVKGIILLLAAVWISQIAKLSIVNFLLRQILQIGFISLIIIFQPEIRRFLDSFGNRKWPFLGRKYSGSNEQVIETVVTAAFELSSTKTGMLIVFERDTGLNEFTSTGTILNASVTVELIKNIFYPNTPLHDGAALIRRERLYAAGCMLPLSTNSSIPRDMGTRHRAAIGITERADAIAVIVSEETGSVSMAYSGMIKRHLTREALEKLMRNALIVEKKESRGFIGFLKAAIHKQGENL